MSVRARLLLTLAALPAVAAHAQAALEIEARPPIAAIGDLFEVELGLTVEVRSLTGPPRFPVWGERWGEAEVVAVGPVDRASLADGRAVYTQLLRVQAFRVGAIELPPVEVTVPYGDRSATVVSPQPLRLEVRPLLEDPADMTRARPPAAPVRPPLGGRFWWVSAALALTCLASLPLLLRYQSSPARALTRSAIDELRHRLGSAVPDQPEAAHTIVSFALRDFLGQTLGWNGAESTTTESIERMQQRRLFSKVLLERTEELLRACDVVKFAHAEVDPDTTTGRLRSAAEIADQVGADSIRRREHGVAVGARTP